jgi:hypothetical protein
VQQAKKTALEKGVENRLREQIRLVRKRRIVPDGSLLFTAEEWGFQVVFQFEYGIGLFERYAGAPFCIMRRR